MNKKVIVGANVGQEALVSKGRPTKVGKKCHLLGFYATQEERDTIDLAVKRDKTDRAEFIRRAVLNAMFKN